MPIVYRIDHEARLVLAAGYGAFTTEDVFGYQRTVWSRPDVQGYNELIDMSAVTHTPTATPERIQDLAALSATMDDQTTRSRFAIVAGADAVYGLGRMFQINRELNAKSTKEVGVFRTMGEALAYLGIEGPVTMPEVPGAHAGETHTADR